MTNDGNITTEVVTQNMTEPQKKSATVGQTVYGLIMLLLFFFKAINFYSLIDVGDYELPLACFTALVPALIYLLLSLLHPKSANIVLTVLYFVLSVIMSVDLIYYSYMGKFPSVGLLTMVWQLGGVEETVNELVTLHRLIPLLDLPLWLIFSFFTTAFPKIRRIFPSALTSSLVRSGRAVALSFVTSALALTLVLCILFGGFHTSFLASEMLTYHAGDFKDFFFPMQLDSIDKSAYTSSSEADNPYYGIAEGRNVFVIQVEALQDFVLGASEKGEEITPFLNSLTENDSFYFENYYYQIGAGNTSDAEFTVNNSLYAGESQSSYERYGDVDFYGLPKLLKNSGYSTASVFHAYTEEYWGRDKAYPVQGFDDYISLEDMEYDEDDERRMGISDEAMFENVVRVSETYEEPFYSFVITLTSHHPFSIPMRDREIDEDNESPNLYTLYVQSVNYVDRALESFFEDIKEAGLYENSVFVIYGDHYALTYTNERYREQILSATGEEYTMFERFKVPLIIHIPGMDNAEVIDTVGGHVDVLPTLLCLLGIHNDKSVMFGHNLLDGDYEGVVYQMTHLRVGSFITKDVLFTSSLGGINSKLYTTDGSSKSLSVCTAIEKEAKRVIEECRMLIDANEVLLP